MTDTLYLVWFDPAVEPPDNLKLGGDAHALADNFWMVRSPDARSRVYHDIKWQLPDKAALLVAPLDDSPDGWPKFKGLQAGALAWLREG